MKSTLCILAFILFHYCSLSQFLILRGKIRCMNPTPTTTKGAENIVVVPTFAPSRTSPTATFPSGYFEINTGLDAKKLQDKILVLQVISKCATCKESVRRVFISDDQQLIDVKQEKQFTTVKDWLLKSVCNEVELKPTKVDSITNVIVKQSGRDINYMPGASVLTGTPALLNLLTTLTTVAGAGGAPNTHYHIKTLQEGDIIYGDFLKSSSMYHTANKGFNFSPTRDLSEAIFWNPSAISFSPKTSNISLLSNVKNNGKLSGFFKVTDKLKVGVGILLSRQDEYRNTIFVSNLATRNEDSMQMNLNEYAAYGSLAYQVNKRLSFGASVKYIGQQFNIPDSLFCNELGKGTFKNKQINNKGIDVDISGTFRPSSSIQIGLNIMNLAGSKLNSDSYSTFTYGAQKPWRSLRSAGLGLAYKYRRLHVGLDFLTAEGGLYDMNIGLNFVPFNNAVFSSGFSIKQKSYSLAFRLKHFRIAYINDNNYLINEKRVERNRFLKGNLYGGFIIDLN